MKNDCLAFKHSYQNKDSKKVTTAAKWIQWGLFKKATKFLTLLNKRKFRITVLDAKLATFLILMHSSELLISMKNKPL